jgi:predicted phosphoribosyltransferase
MASGVSEAIPSAAYLHARSPDDITEDHLKRLVNIILVDSVINNGTTMRAFLKHVRQINATVNIVVVAGVIQEEVLRSNVLTEGLDHTLGLNVVALHVSMNKYTGRGRTDTGNRLFNTIPRE